MEYQKSFIQKIDVAGDKLVEEIQKLYRDAHATRVRVLDRNGKQLVSMPLTIGLGGGAVVATLAPALAIAGAVGGVLGKLRLEVERTGAPQDQPSPAPSHLEDPSDVNDLYRPEDPATPQGPTF